MKKFIEELKRRNVIKASLAYLVIAWVLLQVFQMLLPMVNAPDWTLKGITITMAIGLPVWIIISWIYEITPEGIEKTAKDSGSELATQATNKRLNVFIIVSLSIAVIVMGLKLSDVFSSDSDKKYSIVVLPFKDMSSENTEWFCDGVTDNILNHLSPLKGLAVISRTSSDTYKGTNKKIPEIAKELNVDYLLEGSVTRHNNRVKIITQLINGKDEHIWSKEYSYSFDDIFSVQKNVSKEIVKKVIMTLNPDEEIAIGNNLTDNKEAYQLFLKGRSLQDTKTKQNLELSIKLFQKAVDLDSSYAEAYAEIANSYYLMAPKYLKYDEVKDTINDLIKKSLEIDPNTARAYTVKGLLDIKYFLWESVEENFKKAIDLNPNDAIAHFNYAMYFWNGPIQDVENQLKHLRIANQLEPLSLPINGWLFYSLTYNYQIIEAEEFNNRTGFLFTKNGLIKRESRLNVFKNKDWREAVKLYEEELQKDPNNTEILYQLRYLNSSVLVDRKKALKYIRMAYDLDSTSIRITDRLIWSLIFTKNIKEANEMIEGDNIDEEARNYYLWAEELYSDKPDKIMDYHYKLKNPADKILTFAKLGDINSVNELRTKNQINSREMAKVYAYLKERDSMYYYMNKIPRYIDALNLNMYPGFDPYRKEERYKAFLKKNYLPLTHWNE